MKTCTCSHPKPPLREATFRERIRLTWDNWKARHTTRAMRELGDSLKDPEYRQAWHATIAMAIYDGSRPRCYCRGPGNPPLGHLNGCELAEAYLLGDAYGHRNLPQSQCNYLADRIIKALFP